MTGPSWWIHPGREIAFKSIIPKTQTLTLASAWAEISIKAGPTRNSWIVTYKCHGSSKPMTVALEDDTAWFGGRVEFTTDDLRNAFDLGGAHRRAILTPDEVEAKRYGYDAFAQGLFARKGEFLCIPVAGNGKLPFPNVAIRVTPDLKNQLQTFIELRE